MNSLSKAACLALALAISTTGIAAAPTDAAQPARAPIPAPAVDHHLHLLSPAGSASKLRSIEVPAAVRDLLAEREKNWDNAAGLAPLYTADSGLYVSILNRDWFKGPEDIAGFLATGYTGPYEFQPVSFRDDGSAAQVAGYIVGRDDGEYFSYFHLALRKGADGSWRIATETQLFPGPKLDPPYTAKDLVQKLDEAGIQRGVVLSDAYYFALTPRPVPGEYDRVRAENDWTADQVAQFSGRLVAFCSFHPLRDYALAELERCAASKRFRGIKLHFNAAQINYRSPADVAKARRVMQAANRHRLPVIAHVRSTDDYGREDAEIFLHQIVAAAPDVPVQIAHLWGGETFSPTALEVYADAVASGDKVADNLYFDISGFDFNGKPEDIPQIVAAIRRIGVGRILYASDGPPKESLEKFLKLPLTNAEFRAILDNVAPYLR